MSGSKHLKLKLVSTNTKPVKAGEHRRAPEVEAYCPACKSSTWIVVNHGRADYGEETAVQERCCVHCLANGKVTTW